MDTAPPIGALPRPVVSPLHRRGGEAPRFPSPSRVPITPPRPTVVRLNRSQSPPTCEIAAQLPPSQWLPPPRSPGDDRRSEWAASRRSSLATEAAAAATRTASVADASPAAAYVSSYVGVVSPSPLRSATATPSAIHPQSTPLAALASSDFAPVPVMSPRAVAPTAALPANRDWPDTSPRRVPRPVLGAASTAAADSTPLRLPPRSPGRPAAVEPTSTPSRIQHLADHPATTTATAIAPLAALPTTTPTRRRFDALAGTPEVSPARERPVAARRGSMVEVAAELRRNLDRVKELEYAAGLVPGRSVLTHVSSGKDVTVSPVGKGRAGHTVVSASAAAAAPPPAPLKSPSRLAASPDAERLTQAQARSALLRAAEQQQQQQQPPVVAAANAEVAALRAQLDKAEHLCANLLDDKRSLQRELDTARGTIADLRRQVRRRDEAEGAEAHDDVASYSSLMEVRQRLSSATEPAKTAASSTLTRSPERRHSYY